MDTQQSLSKRLVALAFAALLALGLGFGLVACSSGDSGSGSQQNGQSSQESSENESIAQLDIDTSSVDGGGIKTVDVAISDGSTVADVIEKSGINYSAENGPYGLFVTNIDGLSNGDKGDLSGWMFLVNGEFAEAAMDKCEVKDGDTVTFFYSVAGEMPENLQ